MCPQGLQRIFSIQKLNITYEKYTYLMAEAVYLAKNENIVLNYKTQSSSRRKNKQLKRKFR